VCVQTERENSSIVGGKNRKQAREIVLYCTVLYRTVLLLAAEEEEEEEENAKQPRTSLA